jgi:hypothetical protein
VALVRSDVSEERIACNIRVQKISAVRTTLAVTLNCQFCCLFHPDNGSYTISPKMSVLARATRRHIPEDGIHQHFHTYFFENVQQQNKTHSVALGPQENYTD